MPLSFISYATPAEYRYAFMLRDGHVVMAAVLPENIADDEEAIAAGRAAYAAAATAIDRLEGFEISDLERKVYESAPAPPSAST